MGLTKLKNKVNRNAFDLSHRHMFTAQIGELLPVLCEWVNPNETFKIGFNGITRTTPLNTAAFTRLRENVQYFFVPFQCLWRYFEQTINNMKTGQAGQQIGMIATSFTHSQSLNTSLPYVNYKTLESIVKSSYDHAARAVFKYFKTLSDASTATPVGFYNYIRDSWSSSSDRSEIFNDVFFNGEYRYVGISKLLNALGYGNFNAVITHDVFASAYEYGKNVGWVSATDFLASSYALKFGLTLTHSPNLSVFPLLAYHKIVNDYYRLRNWQSYESWTSNIDYITPDSSMNLADSSPLEGIFDTLSNQNTLFDMEFSNLPLDYFTGVLPRAQYGDESAVPINGASSTAEFSNLKFSTPNISIGEVHVKNDGTLFNVPAISGPSNVDLKTGTADVSTDLISTLKISSLRSAIALQKYKEIQNSNDWSFEEQVLAHFGVKPSCDIHKSRFIGGSDATISINPQINSNFADGAMPDIKAIGASSLSSSCSFKSDTYGVIIGIYRCIPQLDYCHSGINRNLLKTDASDFPLPELDSIGMQTQYRFEVAAPAVGAKPFDAPIDMSATYGYSPRYAELKTSFDRFDGGFTGAYSDWVTGFDENTLKHWFDPAKSGKGYWLDVSSLFICRPSLCYPIFLNQWSGTGNDDKLLVASVNSVTAVRPFSVHGLPWSN